MKRTQVYLDQETRRLAEWQAKVAGTSLSQVLRESVKAYVTPKIRKTKKSPQDFIKFVEELNKKYPVLPGTPTDIALEHDHYLYGTPKKYTKK